MLSLWSKFKGPESETQMSDSAYGGSFQFLDNLTKSLIEGRNCYSQ